MFVVKFVLLLGPIVNSNLAGSAPVIELRCGHCLRSHDLEGAWTCNQLGISNCRRP